MIALTHGNPSNIRSGFGIEEATISGSTAWFDIDDIDKILLVIYIATPRRTSFET